MSPSAFTVMDILLCKALLTRNIDRVAMANLVNSEPISALTYPLPIHNDIRKPLQKKNPVAGSAFVSGHRAVYK
ncbi:uncharacterized protein N7496_003846 [Penicillium cataractarum]|uniref:Uncharacterized protein n=1 Tax=Penicillium cataractarum TaxID=2100454 RepID=A0A9W9SS20_9EURO|nr:uncharacterized protein N7496_003846 [Penicillium cataractarum]KAJ5381418.1 hypothetical protein N7496_003846 [Penicillium cataractarum]